MYEHGKICIVSKQNIILINIINDIVFKRHVKNYKI